MYVVKDFLYSPCFGRRMLKLLYSYSNIIWLIQTHKKVRFSNTVTDISIIEEKEEGLAG